MVTAANNTSLSMDQFGLWASKNSAEKMMGNIFISNWINNKIPSKYILSRKRKDNFNTFFYFSSEKKVEFSVVSTPEVNSLFKWGLWITQIKCKSEIR